ncbi:MAG: WecB/TagA/CpsF family glycosyltransferase [Desulfosoma sp.]
MNAHRILGYSVSARGLQQDVDQALRWIREPGTLRYVACLNPHSVETAAKDPFFRRALENADLLLPDGTGIVLASWLLGEPVKEKVAGFDFFMGVSRRLQDRGGARYFFLGSSDAVLSRMVSRLGRDFPAIQVCGAYSPPFKQVFSREETDRMVEIVNRARPDVLWVGMTAPKQEKWIYENRHRLNVPLAAAVGAVFDFYAGTKPRSGPGWIALGLEWLPRFLREPKRLWERNMKSTPRFLVRVLREKTAGR